jgi:hypothetical protein
LSSYLVNEANFLREKLNRIIRDYTLNKIKQEEYESSLGEILEAIGKVTSVLKYNFK